MKLKKDFPKQILLIVYTDNETKQLDYEYYRVQNIKECEDYVNDFRKSNPDKTISSLLLNEQTQLFIQEEKKQEEFGFEVTYSLEGINQPIRDLIFINNHAGIAETAIKEALQPMLRARARSFVPKNFGNFSSGMQIKLANLFDIDIQTIAKKEIDKKWKCRLFNSRNNEPTQTWRIIYNKTDNILVTASEFFFTHPQFLTTFLPSIAEACKNDEIHNSYELVREKDVADLKEIMLEICI